MKGDVLAPIDGVDQLVAVVFSRSKYPTRRPLTDKDPASCATARRTRFAFQSEEIVCPYSSRAVSLQSNQSMTQEFLTI